MTRAPPAAAAWLLRRLVAADRSDALLGDLFEEYQAGRTTGWYWRETLIALFISMRQGVARVLACPRAHFILLGRHVRVRLKSGLIRLSLAALIALGFGGGAVTWAGTSACTVSPSVCSSSSTAEPCIPPSHSN
jgi:hypothetical protein